MLNNAQTLIDIVYMILLGGIVVGGIFAFRHGSTKETQETMQRLNETLDGEITALRRRVDDLERERATQDRVIATIRYALKSRGLHITISGDFVQLRDATGKTITTPIQDRAKVAPIAPSDDDDTAS